MIAANVSAGRIFRAVSRHGSPWGKGISENVIWYVVRRCAERMQLEHLAPHDLRRTCATLWHANSGEIEQIQFLLGHASVLTTERSLGCKQNLEEPVNDRFGCLFSFRTVELRIGLFSSFENHLMDPQHWPTSPCSSDFADRVAVVLNDTTNPTRPG
jgi:hypothetical protein